jgi:Flp pilus assembly protein TadG
LRFHLIRHTQAGLRGLTEDRRGNVAVELALAMPALCLFIFGIIGVGYALWVQNALDYAVATAARCASLNGAACTGKLSDGTYAASLSGATVAASVFSYSPNLLYPTVGCGCQVSASRTMSLDVPWTDLSVTLSSRACFPPKPLTTCPAT